jgi:hypothetical protein
MQLCIIEDSHTSLKEDVMKIVLFSALSIVVLAGAPLAAADETPSAAASLCSLAPNPLQVDFDFNAQCTVVADCNPFPDKTCTSGVCEGKDRNCSIGQRGYVDCGTRQYCAGACCGSDGVCEYSYGCGCTDPDCCFLAACRTAPECTCDCGSVTNCRSDKDCCDEGSICLSNGICLCAN